MFGSLLVPLDGSRLAERALPFAMKLARAADGRLLLVQALPSRTAAAPTIDLDYDREAIQYDLDELASSLCAEGVRTRALVVEGSPADVIVELAEQQPIDLIVMSTHGRSGMDHWLYGSVALDVLREAPVPVLLVPGNCDRAWTPGSVATGRRILVPLDGTAIAEGALPAALAIARLLGDELQLVQAIDPVSYASGDALGDRVTDVGDELDASQSYLQQQAAAVRNQGGRAIIDAAIGSPVHVIVDRARDRAVDAVVMVTRGRGGVEELVFGTVAGSILHQVRVPLLLLRPVAQLEASNGMTRPQRIQPIGEPTIDVSLSPREIRLIRLALERLLEGTAPNSPEQAVLGRLLARVTVRPGYPPAT